MAISRKFGRFTRRQPSESEPTLQSLWRMIAKLECSYRHFFFVSICRPFILWAQEPIIQLLGLYLAFIYGIMYCELR